MKLVSLNIFGGKWHEPLISFLKEQQKEIDVFCFQEVFHTASNILDAGWGARTDNFDRLSEILVDFQPFNAPVENGYIYTGKADFDVSYGLAMFIRKGISVAEHGNTMVYKEHNPADTYGGYCSNLQYAAIEREGDLPLTIANMRGVWIKGNDKTDTEHRLTQSENIKKILHTIPNQKVLCGDFNLRPDTKSLAILEDGMRNLVKEYKVSSTRSSFYEKECKFADYILVSPDIKVNDFKVLPVEVSDHLPLLLDCEVPRS